MAATNQGWPEALATHTNSEATMLYEVSGLFQRLFEDCVFHMVPFLAYARISELVSLRVTPRLFVSTRTRLDSHYLHATHGRSQDDYKVTTNQVFVFLVLPLRVDSLVRDDEELFGDCMPSRFVKKRVISSPRSAIRAMASALIGLFL
jgi:hypothetical protein